MEVVKIDIKKEIVDLPEGKPYLITVEHKGGYHIVPDGLEPLAYMNEELRKEYRVRRLRRENGEMVLYLVPMNEFDLFDDMLITANDIVEEQAKKVPELEDKIKLLIQENSLFKINNDNLRFQCITSHARGFRSGVEYIRELPWYKRLLCIYE